MKTLFILARVMLVLIMAMPVTVEGQKRKSTAPPVEKTANTYLRNRVTSESGGALSLAGFRKTNGYEQGFGIYVMEWQAEILFEEACWKPGDIFQGYWQNFGVMLRQPNNMESILVGVGSAQYFDKGTKIRLTGDTRARKTEKGWRLEGFEVKTSQVLFRPQTVPSGPIEFVRKNILTGECTKIETGEVVPCPDQSGSTPLAVPPGTKPPTNAKPTPTPKPDSSPAANRVTQQPVLTSAIAYYNRGNSHNKQRNFALAIEDYTKAIEIDPQLGPAYINRGVAYRKSGNLDQAMADYNKGIEVDPSYGEAYVNRARAYCLSGNKSLAQADERKAKELGVTPTIPCQ